MHAVRLIYKIIPTYAINIRLLLFHEPGLITQTRMCTDFIFTTLIAENLPDDCIIYSVYVQHFMWATRLFQLFLHSDFIN